MGKVKGSKFYQWAVGSFGSFWFLFLFIREIYLFIQGRYPMEFDQWALIILLVASAICGISMIIIHYIRLCKNVNESSKMLKKLLEALYKIQEAEKTTGEIKSAISSVFAEAKKKA